MLAAHSYGGVPGCQTVSGLERSKRKAEGKPGGVVHVLFIAALLVEQNQKLVEALEGGKLPPFAVFKVRKSVAVAPFELLDDSLEIPRLICGALSTGWSPLPCQHQKLLLWGSST